MILLLLEGRINEQCKICNECNNLPKEANRTTQDLEEKKLNTYISKSLVHQIYIRRRSVAPVIRLHIGQSFVEPKQRNQHSLQHVCQHPVETVGSLYWSRHIRQRREAEDDTRIDS